MIQEEITMGKKLIITAALCGAGTMKSQTP